MDDFQLAKLRIDALSANVQRVASRNTQFLDFSSRREQSEERELKVVFHTSQQRTRIKKRIKSDCFFFCSSSTYLRAPICGECRY